jgi:Cutinase
MLVLRRQLLVSGAVILAVAGGLIPAAEAAAARLHSVSRAASSQCAQVAFISVRGSGQAYKGATDLSVSPQTNAVLTGIRDQLKIDKVPATIAVYQLPYKAISDDVLTARLKFPTSAADAIPSLVADWHQLMHVNLPTYITSEEQGESELYAYLAQIYQSCQSAVQRPMVVLAGYSQGSMVVHNVLNAIATANQTELMSIIKGAALLGDPERMKSSVVPNGGSAPRGDYGLCHALDVLIIPHSRHDSCVPPGPTRDVAKYFADVAYQVCEKNDLACDTSGVLKLNPHAVPSLTSLLHLKQELQLGARVHTTGYSGSDVTGLGRDIGRNLVADGL